MTDELHKAAARTHKAHRIADVLEVAANKLPSAELSRIRECDETFRAEAARAARVNDPSDEAWQEAVDVLIVRRAAHDDLVAKLRASFDRRANR